MEWAFLRKYKRKKRTFVVVLGFIGLLLAMSETLYLVRDRFQLGELIETVFGSIEDAVL